MENNTNKRDYKVVLVSIAKEAAKAALAIGLWEAGKALLGAMVPGAEEIVPE